MRKISTILTTAIVASAAAGGLQAQDPELSAEEKALMDEVSIAYGTRLARDLREDGIYLDIDKFKEAFVAVSTGQEALADDEAIDSAFEQLREHMKAQQNKAQTEYLAENGKKEGVVTTDSGLQYEVLKEAKGAKPSATDQVTVHYHGMLINGDVFDSSVDRGSPATFPLNGVIKGWTEGVQLMPVGSKFKFTIPSDLAYGDRGSPPKIQGGATLIFEVELLSIGGQ